MFALLKGCAVAWHSPSLFTNDAGESKIASVMVTKTNPWYVLTGASSSGKTTLAKSLAEKGFKVCLEVAREVIDQGIAQGLSVPEIRADERAFQSKVHQLKIERERLLSPNQTVFFDRGIPDTIPYFQLINAPIEELEPTSKNCSYRKVFLLDRLPYELDYARIENEEEQGILHKNLERVYKELGFPVVQVPVLPLAQRVDFILREIETEI